MNLSMVGADLLSIPVSGTQQLFVQGITGASGQFSTMTLFIEGAALSGTMNLVVVGPTTLANSGIMNLVTIGGGVIIPPSSISLFVSTLSSSSVFDGNTPLFVEGLQLTQGSDPFFPSSGFIPSTGNFNLFIKRDPSDTITLFISADSHSGNIPLFITSASGTNDNITLMIPSLDNTNNTIPLFTYGF